LVERGPEKAGVGGSIPSLATNISTLATAKKRVRISRANNTRTSVASDFTSGAARSNNFHIPVSLVLPRDCSASLSSALRHLDVRVAQDFCELVEIAAFVIHDFRKS
jgi:hypothetical protein